jgi:hypothetical protein
MVDRWLREAVFLQPELAAHRAWFAGEVRRGDPAEIANAGRALGEYDARPFAGSVVVPTAVLVTTKDRLVRPSKQRALAKAITGSKSFELAADHDVPFINPKQFGAMTKKAVEAVVAELSAPSATRPIGLVSERAI